MTDLLEFLEKEITTLQGFLKHRRDEIQRDEQRLLLLKRIHDALSAAAR